MTQPAGRLLDEALRLTEQERAELTSRLIESLDPAVEGDVNSAWNAEVQRRLGELDRGRVSAVPWAEARRMIVND